MRATMRPITFLAAAVIVALSATATMATFPAEKCDAAKSKTSGKFFAACMKCHSKLLADSTFDLAGCLSDALAKCTLGFDNADNKYPSDCAVIGNGAQICQDTQTACENIYPGI